MINISAGINREMGRHMEACILASDFLGKFYVIWYQFSAEIEAFQLHLAIMNYGEGAGAAGKAECWNVVLTIVQVIWRELRKVRLEAETAYVSDNLTDMVGQYIWGTLQANWAIDVFLQTELLQNTEVDPHINLYLFEHRAPRVEVSDLKQRVEAQAKTLNKMEKTRKELWARVDLLTEKANILSKKLDKGYVEERSEGISNTKESGGAINDEAKTSEENHKGDVIGERYLVREKREWRSDHTKGTYVIWCGRMPFYHLVVGEVGLRVTWIWGGSDMWRH